MYFHAQRINEDVWNISIVDESVTASVLLSEGELSRLADILNRLSELSVAESWAGMV